MRVIDCRVFVQIPKEEISKFDGKTKQWVFSGYDHDDFGYRFWDAKDKKVIISWGVVFFKGQTIKNLGKTRKLKLIDIGYVDLCLEPLTMVINYHKRDIEVNDPMPQLEVPIDLILPKH